MRSTPGLRVRLAAVCLAALALPGLAEDEPRPPSRHLIDGVEPMSGRDAMVKALTRALRVTTDPTLSEHYLFGVSGMAFLTTVCANNCNCRDFREMYTEIDVALAGLGVPNVFLEGKDPAIWEQMKASIAAGVPVSAWGLYGDGGDAVMVGYDEEQDLAYGWGMKPGGSEYMTAPLSKFTSGWMSSYVVRPGEPVDRVALERKQLELAVRMAYRDPLEGG